MNALTVLTSEIRLHDGLYSLNDLHKASGGSTKDKPANFMRLDTTQALIDEIRCSDLSIIPTKTITGRGKAQGTYVCKELVYAYAMWISPKFNLAVIRAFDALHTGVQPTPPPVRQIRCRDDLSFTARDHRGNLINWFVPSRAGSWHEHHSIGQAWFQEIIELSRHSPEAAYQALLCAGCSNVLLKHWNYGHERGFMDVFARYAMAGLLADQGKLPELPFKVLEMGTVPLADLPPDLCLTYRRDA